MTCIVGLVSDNGTVIIGADSGASEGDGLVARNDSKVFFKRNLLIGFSGSFRVGQIIQYVFKIPKHGFECDMEYLVGPFVSSLRECLKINGGLSTDNGIDTMEASLLVGYRQHLYEIHSDFQVSDPSEQFSARGSAAPIALGALWTHKDLGHLSAHDAVLASLSAAEESSSAVRGPFHILELYA